MGKTGKIVLIVLLAIAMLFSAACSAAGTGIGGPAAPAEVPEKAEDPGKAAEKPEAVSEQEEKPSQAAEKNGDIIILYTSDVHCGIDEGFGYAGLEQVRDYFIAKGDEVILVDDGDSFQGEPVGTMTKGESIITIMNDMGYDVATPGNHDFDYGMEQFLKLVGEAEFPYISCNFNYKGELVFEPYIILERAGKKIAFVGVTTPETLTTSTPAYFKDENGDFVYGFLQDSDGSGVYNAVQAAVDSARAEGADFVAVMAHLGNAAESAPYTYGDVITHTYGIDVFFDGHSHDTDQVVVKDLHGRDVPRGGVGTKLACVGWCRIAADGTISTGLYTWNNAVAAPELLGIVNEMSKAVDEAENELSDELDKVVAKTSVELTINDPTEVDSNGEPVRMIRRAETNLGDLCADAFRVLADADIGFSGGGGIRTGINAGDITMRDILSVYPFGNYLCVVEASGQQILDALEWGARAVPAESGGFMQVSGLSYEIHSYIDSTCTADEDEVFTGVSGERRVRNVLVNGEPLDPEKSYTVASIDYWLLENGDGFSMFTGDKLLLNKVKLDNQVLIDYMTGSLNGVIGEEYEDPTGQGRIVIVDEKP